MCGPELGPSAEDTGSVGPGESAQQLQRDHDLWVSCLRSVAREALKLSESLALPRDQPADSESRIVKEVEKRTNLLPPGVPEFDHYLPPLHLNELTPGEIKESPDCRMQWTGSKQCWCG